MRSRPKTKKHEWMNEWNWTTYVCDPSNSGANGTTACYAVVFSIDQRMRENRTRARGAQSRLSNQSDRWMDNVRTFKIPRDKDVMAMRGPGMHMDNTQHKVYLYSINRFFFFFSFLIPFPRSLLAKKFQLLLSLRFIFLLWYSSRSPQLLYISVWWMNNFTLATHTILRPLQ